MVAAAHHVLAFNPLKVGLSRKVRHGRQANLRVRAIFSHPLGEVLAAVEHALLTVVNTAHLNAFQVVGGRYDRGAHDHRVARYGHAGAKRLDRLVARSSKKRIYFVHVERAVGARLDHAPFAVMRPRDFNAAQHRAHKVLHHVVGQHHVVVGPGAGDEFEHRRRFADYCEFALELVDFVVVQANG
uniref:Uncharacterized protein n=1 Tax=Choristoneura fumiferana nuclear polyhedrosis virus TaxID=208973 RepID=Q6LCC4_NPVCF|nr:unknown [Choristoneura fumiferana multiple nucleopolyhedrovirus]